MSWHEFNQWMDTPFVQNAVFTLTAWKCVGFIGMLLFASRWLVQAWYRKRTGSREVPTAFWVLSLIGAFLTTLYFVFGKNDMIGILQNALPASVALWNLISDLRLRRAQRSR